MSFWSFLILTLLLAAWLGGVMALVLTGHNWWAVAWLIIVPIAIGEVNLK